MDFEEADRNALKKAEAAMGERAIVNSVPNDNGNSINIVAYPELDSVSISVLMSGHRVSEPATVNVSALVRTITGGRVPGMRAESRAWIERKAREIRKTIQDSPDTRRTFDMPKMDMLAMLDWLYVLTESARELKDES